MDLSDLSPLAQEGARLSARFKAAGVSSADVVRVTGIHYSRLFQLKCLIKKF